MTARWVTLEGLHGPVAVDASEVVAVLAREQPGTVLLQLRTRGHALVVVGTVEEILGAIADGGGHA